MTWNLCNNDPVCKLYSWPLSGFLYKLSSNHLQLQVWNIGTLFCLFEPISDLPRVNTEMTYLPRCSAQVIKMYGDIRLSWRIPCSGWKVFPVFPFGSTGGYTLHDLVGPHIAKTKIIEAFLNKSCSDLSYALSMSNSIVVYSL